MHYNASREVKQNGREGWPLHAGHIRLEDSSPEGLQDFPSDFNVPGIVHNSWQYYELGHHSVCDFTTGTIMNCEAMHYTPLGLALHLQPQARPSTPHHTKQAA